MNKIFISSIGFLFDIPYKLIQYIHSQINLAYTIIAPLTYTLLSLEIATIGILMVTHTISNANQILLRTLKLSILFYVVTHIDVIASALVLGFRVVAERLTPDIKLEHIFSNPEEMFRSLIEKFITPVKEEIRRLQEDNYNAFSGFKNIVENIQNFLVLKGKVIMMSVLFLGMFILFTFMVIQILLAKLEFSIVMFFSILLAPFMLNEKLKFLSDNIFRATFNTALKIGMSYFLIGITYWMLQKEDFVSLIQDFNLETLVSILLYCFIGVYLAIYGPKIALTLTSGTPQLGATQMIQMASQMSTTVAAIRYLGKNTQNNLTSNQDSKKGSTENDSHKMKEKSGSQNPHKTAFSNHSQAYSSSHDASHPKNKGIESASEGLQKPNETMKGNFKDMFDTNFDSGGF